jgi:glycerol kinase
MKRILAIDQGTTATKSYTLDTDGHFVFCGSAEHRQIYPQPGWVEHDPEILLGNILTSIEAAIDIEAIGIDNQGETVIAWDGVSGIPVYNAIVWQDQRSTQFIETLKAKGIEHLTLARAGLPLDPYFSASKLRWILKHVPQADRLLKKGQLMLGTSDSFFIYRLTGEYATDVTTASRTSLMNLET